MSEELKPCPFCGSEDVDPRGWASHESAGPACLACGASAGSALASWEENVGAWQARASFSQAGEPVAVKPLEWGTPIGQMWRVKTEIGVFLAWPGHDGVYQWSYEGVDNGEDYGGSASSLEAAKAAAQADYERRIRSCLVSAPPAAPAAEVDTLSPAARDVLAERRRQIETEGWTPEHDDAHDKHEMAQAAACYALTWSFSPTESKYLPYNFWPWSLDWWKPTNTRGCLVKAGALILAEIERLDRAAIAATHTSQKEG